MVDILVTVIFIAIFLIGVGVIIGRAVGKVNGAQEVVTAIANDLDEMDLTDHKDLVAYCKGIIMARDIIHNV